MTKFTLPEGVPKKAKPAKLHERESVIEEYLRTRVASLGGIAYKFTSPQRRSVPDRLVLGASTYPAAEVLREACSLADQYDGSAFNIPEDVLDDFVRRIVAEMVHFVELKATGEKPTELQKREHEKLRARGFQVVVIDSKAEVDRRYPNDDGE